MASRKLDEPHIRGFHCTVYTAALMPFITFCVEWPVVQAAVFGELLLGSHFVIDSKQW